MPMGMSATSTALIATATPSRVPLRPSVSPPAGTRPSCAAVMSDAARMSATPIATRTVCLFHLATRPAPIHAPTTAAAMIVRMSTATIAMKMNAWAIVGGMWPTLSVSGMRRSDTERRRSGTIVYSAVVAANDPMPNVSKKLVTP